MAMSNGSAGSAQYGSLSLSTSRQIIYALPGPVLRTAAPTSASNNEAGQPTYDAVNNPARASGIFHDETISMLVGTCPIREHKVFKTVMSVLLADPKFREQNEAMENGRSVVLAGVESEQFQQVVKLIYAGYPEDHILEVLKSYPNSKLVSIYDAALYFGLQELSQESIYVLESNDTSMSLLNAVRSIYARENANDEFRHLVRSKIGELLDMMVPTDITSWEDSEFTASNVKKELMNSTFPSTLRQDILQVLVDRETARAEGKDTDGCADGSAPDAMKNDEADLDGKNEKTLFIAGFPTSYDTLEIITEVMLLSPATEDNKDVDISIQRSNNSSERRYVQLTFTTPEDAIAAYEDFVEKPADQKRPVFVDWAYNDIRVNFMRFAAFNNGQGRELNQILTNNNAVANKDSDDWECSLQFKAGDLLENLTFSYVVRRSATGQDIFVPLFVATRNGVVGTFPTSFVDLST